MATKTGKGAGTEAGGPCAGFASQSLRERRHQRLFWAQERTGFEPRSENRLKDYSTWELPLISTCGSGNSLSPPEWDCCKGWMDALQFPVYSRPAYAFANALTALIQEMEKCLAIGKADKMGNFFIILLSNSLGKGVLNG